MVKFDMPLMEYGIIKEEKREKVMKCYVNHGRRVRTLLCAVFFLCSIFLLPQQATAAGTIQITACESVSATALALSVTLPDLDYETCEVYRGTTAPEAGGTLQLIDTISLSGNSWTSQNSSDWYTYGNNRKIIFISSTAKLLGQITIGDAGVNLGQTYYYQIVLRPSSDSSDTAVSSNVISGQTKLNAPDILKGYASTSTAVKLYWSKVSSASGYEVYRQNGTAWKKVKTNAKASKITYTNKKLKAKKTYKYKVRAYATVNGKKIYSDFSDVFSVKTKTPTVKGSYKKGSVYGPSLSTSKLTQVRRVVQSFKDNFIRSGMSDYEKVWIAFCYIRANCDYAWRGWQYNGANTAWGALVYGEAQCSGYARGMKALCDAIGVSCRYVHANSKAANPSHQWNMVKISGKWYILDAQGGFFLVGSKSWLGTTGMSWNKSGLPKCSTADHPQGGFVSSEM